VKPFGPVHAYVAPATVDAVSWSVPPTQTAPPLPAVGADGIGLTVVVALEELLAEDGSLTDDDTEAAFTADPAVEGASIVTVIAGAAPIASEARVHVTVVVPEHDQPVPAAETSVAPAGRTSETETVVAVDGPAFETASVYVIGWSVQICAGAPDWPIERSARANTVDEVAAVLLAETGSAVTAETVAELEMPPASAGAVTTTEIGDAEASPSDGIVQVTGPVPEHDHPVPDAETKDAPAGSVSTTESVFACDGPVFVTVSV
jgi:hypothetical protein